VTPAAFSLNASVTVSFVASAAVPVSSLPSIDQPADAGVAAAVAYMVVAAARITTSLVSRAVWVDMIVPS
jgi:hypothetical protein